MKLNNRFRIFNVLLVFLCINGTALVQTSCAAHTHISSPSTTPASPTNTRSTPSATSPVMPVAVTPPSTGICTSGQLAAAVLEHSGAAGTIYAAIRLSNTSPISCTLSGFPEITGISTDGSPIALQENNSDGPQSPFAIYGTFPLVATLPPHGEGAFVLAYTDVPEGSSTCIQLMRLTVAPPSGGGTLQVSFPATLCSTVISVSPVKVGLSFLSP